jgi:hypothetical protein
VFDFIGKRGMTGFLKLGIMSEVRERRENLPLPPPIDWLLLTESPPRLLLLALPVALKPTEKLSLMLGVGLFFNAGFKLLRDDLLLLGDKVKFVSESELCEFRPAPAVLLSFEYV